MPEYNGRAGGGGFLRIDHEGSGTGEEIILPDIRWNGGDGAAHTELSLVVYVISDVQAWPEAAGQIETISRLIVDDVILRAVA